jgi:uncharacterized protein
MRRRLRKKLFVGEFKEMGFYVRFRLAENLSEEDLSAFFDQFLTEVIEAQDLYFGGGGHRDWQGFVGLNRRGSVTEEHRNQVSTWLGNHPQVLEHELSDLRDAWYDSRDWP